MSSFEESDPSDLIEPLLPGDPPPLEGSWEVRLRDGTVIADIAGIAMDKQLVFRLNRPAQCSFRVPSYLVNDIQADGYPTLTTGRRQISVTLISMGLCFHGI